MKKEMLTIFRYTVRKKVKLKKNVKDKWDQNFLNGPL